MVSRSKSKGFLVGLGFRVLGFGVLGFEVKV